jgi:thiol-disulfide isomerase/thioredoxin
MFICNHCPFVHHIRKELARLANDYINRDVSIIAINSNDYETHPGDSPEKMKDEIMEWGYNFPYLVDEDQSVAIAYQASCTPDFFLFDSQQQLVYRGQLDGGRPSNDIPVNGRDIRAALDTLLAGDDVSEEQIPSVGCNIKWKPNNSPEWFN